VGIYVGKNPIPVDTAMIAQLNEIEKTEESIAKKHILNNRHNSTTTIYYLLLKRHLRKGGMSIADITKYNAEDFKPAHPNPVRKLQFIQKHRSQSQDCEPADLGAGASRKSQPGQISSLHSKNIDTAGKKRDGSQVEEVKPSVAAPKLASQIKLKKEVASAIPKKPSHSSSK